MNDNFLRDYNELKAMSFDLGQLIRSRIDKGKGDQGTVVLEQQITKELDKFNSKLQSITKGYTEKYKKSDNQIDASKRINQLNDLDKVYKSQKASFDEILDNKYKYVSITLLILYRNMI